MNNDIIQLISLVLSIFALVLVVFVFVVNIYFRIRKSFPIKVNCWFCNSWSKVPYDNRNSFDCPSCLQYNGFTEDGSYNKIIEAQHDVALNKRTPINPFTKSSNGFCDSCNHNQQLKIAQLASFTPLKEANYNLEIDHFKSQLEKAYQLCKQCSRVLKSTLLREKASFLGKHVFNIQKKGQKLHFDKSIEFSTTQVLVKIVRNIQGFVACTLILYLTLGIVFNDQEIPKVLPSFLSPYYELSQDLFNLFSGISCDYCHSFINNSFDAECNCLEFFASVGLILQFLSFLMQSSVMTVKVNQLLCWSFLTLTSLAVTQETLIYTQLFQMLCASIIFYNSFYECSPGVRDKKTFNKIPKSTEEDWYDNSDDELDISFHSEKTNRSFVNDFGSSKNSFNLSTNSVTKANSSHYDKTESDKLIANKVFDTSPNTARSLNNSMLYSNIRNSLEDLHLGGSSFTLGKVTTTPFNSRPLSPFSDCSKQILSPSKLKSVTQNSWVAGGFWRNEDGTVVPINEEPCLSRSSSQSSGFVSQINEPVHNFSNPFSSLPTSRKSSLCGDWDRFSLASEPPYHFNQTSPHPTRSGFYKCMSPNYPVNAQFNNTFGSIHKSACQSFNEISLPTANRLKNPLPLYSTSKPLGLFKLPEACPSVRDDLTTIFKNDELGFGSTNPFHLTRKFNSL